MLLVLICLKDDSGKSGGSANRLRRAKEAMASIKTVIEEFANISLAAGESAGGQEIKVVNMNVAMIMSIAKFWLQNADFGIFLGTFSAEL